jgi:hypothetical protein
MKVTTDDKEIIAGRSAELVLPEISVRALIISRSTITVF